MRFFGGGFLLLQNAGLHLINLLKSYSLLKLNCYHDMELEIKPFA